MKLPNLPKFGKKGIEEYYLSLVLRNDKASAVIFNQDNGKINVVGEHIEHFKAPLDDVSDEELLDTIDKAVSVAEKNLPEGVESQKTIFGVGIEWTENGKIKKQYLDKLKKVSEELAFKPIGFLIVPEAIAHLMHKEEGAPVTALIAEFDRKRVIIYNLIAGKIVDSKSAPLSASPVKTVESLMKNLDSTTPLPERIILFDGGDESLQQDFISHKWDESLNFLHVPQVTTLPSNYDARAVLNGAGSQMGLEVFETSLLGAAAAHKLTKPHSEKKESVAAVEEDKTLAEAVSEFGFSDEDIGKKEKKETAIMDNIKEVDDSVNVENPKIQDQLQEIPEEVKLETTSDKNLPVKASLLMVSIRNGFGKIKIGGIFGRFKRSPKKFALLLIPLILLIILGYFYFFTRSATVTINVNSRQEQLTEDVTFSQTKATSAKDNIISSEFLTVSQDGKKSTPTTGKKETGEKAKGTVTIFNNTDSTITFTTGTLLANEDLTFLTDKAVTVASQSGEFEKEAGKANVTATAKGFGTDYNVGVNTRFEVDGGSTFLAKNDNAFTGGTTKTLKIVSEEDTEKLAKDLEKDLEPKAKDSILKVAAEGSVVLPNFISSKFTKESYSKDIGQEANEVSLTGVISFEGISYKKEEMEKYALEKFAEKLADDMTINSDALLITAKKLEKDKNGATGELTIKAGLVPKINEDELAKQISGKSNQDVINELSKLSDVRSIDISSTFDFLPFIGSRLPFSSSKIIIIVDQDG